MAGLPQYSPQKNSRKKQGRPKSPLFIYINCFNRCLMGIACAQPILRELTYQAISSIKVVRLFCEVAVWAEPLILL